MIGPDAGQAVGLQLDLHLDVVSFSLAAGCPLRLLRLGENSQQICTWWPTSWAIT